MRKILVLFLFGWTLFITSCSANNIKYTIERLGAGVFSRSYAEIVNTEDDAVVILYCEFTSGTYKPKIINVSKDKGIITYTVKQYTRSNLLTCDMAYWKLVVDVDPNFILGINEVKVVVVY